MNLVFKNIKYPVTSLAEASKKYLSIRGNSLDNAYIEDESGNEIGGLSLNGSIWDGYGTKAKILYFCPNL